MSPTQSLFISLFALFNLAVFTKGYYETRYKKNAYGLTPPLLFIGTFVWGDTVIICPFWIFSGVAALARHDWYLFLLITSLFWVVRSIGEAIYWFNQQFSPIDRNPISTHPWRDIFHNDSAWFITQIIWQCLMVFALIFSLYFSWMWLHSLS